MFWYMKRWNAMKQCLIRFFKKLFSIYRSASPWSDSKPTTLCFFELIQHFWSYVCTCCNLISALTWTDTGCFYYFSSLLQWSSQWCEHHLHGGDLIFGSRTESGLPPRPHTSDHWCHGNKKVQQVRDLIWEQPPVSRTTLGWWSCKSGLDEFYKCMDGIYFWVSAFLCYYSVATWIILYHWTCCEIWLSPKWQRN